MQVERACPLTVRTVVHFRRKIANVLMSRVVPDFEHALHVLTQQPKIPHIHCTRTLPFDRVIDDTDGGGVVDMDGGGRLWVPHFLQDEPNNLGVHGIEEEGAEFGLSGGCGDAF